VLRGVPWEVPLTDDQYCHAKE